MASQLTLIKSRRLLPKVAERWMKQRILSKDPPFSTWKSTVLTSSRRVDGLTARESAPSIIQNQRWNWFMTIPNYFMIAPRWISSWLSQNHWPREKKIPPEPYNHCKGWAQDWGSDGPAASPIPDRSQVLLDLFPKQTDLKRSLLYFCNPWNWIKIQVTVIQDRAFGEIYLNRIEHEQISWNWSTLYS